VTALARLAGRTLARWETLLVAMIVAVGVWSASLSPFFLTRVNLLDLATPYVFIGLMAFGLALVVIAGEIDISVASTLAVSVVTFAQVFQAGASIWLAALVGLGVATVLGCVNGFLVGVLELPSLAVTLGTLAAFRGLAFVILGGEGVASFPTSYTNIGSGYIRSELPIALLVLLASALVLGVVLHATRFGRYLYAIGSNREAARFSGIPVRRVRLLIFGLSGFMAGLAGVVYVGFFGSARADAAEGSLLDVVTVVVLGGVDIFGGSGSMLGVLLAFILVAELRNGMQLANVGGDTQNIVIGALLLAAILAGNLARAVQAGDVGTRIARWRRRGVMRSEDRIVGVPAQTKVEDPRGG
jgi:rhamnose transport system permease protein